MIKFNKRSTFLAALLISSSFLTFPVYAGSSSGKINWTLPTAGGLYIFSAGVISTKPSCATIDEWAVDTSSWGGKMLAAAIIAAQAQGAIINVSGQGICNAAFGPRELVSSFLVITR